MKRYLVVGVVAAVLFASGAYAQPGSFRSHLVRNAQVFGANGQSLGIIDSMTLGGGIVLRLAPSSKAAVGDIILYDDGPAPGSNDADLRVLPAGSVVWNGYGLKANVTAKDLRKLPSPDWDS